MKKNLFTILLAFSILGNCCAQCFTKNSFVLNAGVGALSLYGYNHYGYFGKSYGIPTISVSGDKGFKQLGPGLLSFGATAELKEGGYVYDPAHYNGNSYGENWSHAILAARAAYHPFQLDSSRYEFYGALQLGIRFHTYHDSYFEATATSTEKSKYNYAKVSPFYSVTFGGRYFLTKTIAVFVELGYDMAIIKGGFSIKIK